MGSKALLEVQYLGKTNERPFLLESVKCEIQLQVDPD